MKEIALHNNWLIKAPVEQVFNIVTDFEKFPSYFPKVAQTIQIKKREANYLEIEAGVKSFGKLFPVMMKTHIVPGRGFTSDNNSPVFGTSGHEELLLSENEKGTVIDYTYKVTIHKAWSRIVATPLIKWYAMKSWEKAVISNLKRMLEK